VDGGEVRAIDLFAGAGGFTTGAERAGARVVWAANHWALAVETHAANHPGVAHSCQDLHQVDWSTVPRHELLLASPACQGHSNARNGHRRRYHDSLRATAWAVVSCAEVHLPRVLVVENVVGFERWKLFPIWREALERLGYRTTVQVLNAADFGVPQARKRLFIVGSRGRALVLRPGRCRHRAADTFIDWSAGEWERVRDSRSPLVHRQWKNGRRVHGRRFLFAYHTCKFRGVSRELPIGTITTKRSWGLINGDRYRTLTTDEYRGAMGFSASYRLPARSEDALKMLGNAVPPPLAAGVIRQILEAA
jgi:DNA (cytosine-5)-methyltransferase 1